MVLARRNVRGFVAGGWSELHTNEGDLQGLGHSYRINLGDLAAMQPSLQQKDWCVLARGYQQALVWYDCRYLVVRPVLIALAADGCSRSDAELRCHLV